MSIPHYVTTGRGQVRIWFAGEGPTLVLLAGPSRAASVQLQAVADALPGWRIVAVEPPGVGGSSGVAAGSVEEAADAVAEALTFLAGEPFALLACELAGACVPALLERLPRQPTATVLLEADRAAGWARVLPASPSFLARSDGAHLNALWSFLRDRRLLRPDDPTLPISSGDPVPGAADLSAGFVDAVTVPAAFMRTWDMLSRAFTEGVPWPSKVVHAGRTSDLADALGNPPAPSSAVPGRTVARPGTAVWHEYLDTDVGRVHLRRAGSTGRPVLVLPTGGGSSAQFAPVLSGLSTTRTAVAMDYFGNGLSETRDRIPTITDLAAEAFAVADALGWGTFDVWGSHTGACVALEMAICRPERVGRAVLEAPVMVTPEFRADLLANYFPDFCPHTFGLHLQHVWNWRRDMFMFWPWYRREHAATRAIGVPTAEELHLYAVGILESGTSYDGAYRAGFGYDTRARLPELRRPAILTAGPNDMLANALDDAASLVPDGLLDIVPTPTTVWWPDPEPAAAAKTLQVYREFLG
jgi:pimeloyl-ACP methyl ester carboxylesterase